jgi:hypothetical protein
VRGRSVERQSVLSFFIILENRKRVTLKPNLQFITRGVGRKVLVAKKNSPHIFFVGGVVGVVGSAFLACRATLKLEEKIDEIKDDLNAVKELNRRNNSGVDEKSEAYKYTAYVSVKSAVVFGKLYGPSVALGAVSIAALTGSHIQLTRRNAALSATLAVVTKAYEEYRVKIQNEIGKARELDIYRGITEKEIDVDGKKKKIKVIDPNGHSPYARFFDESSVNWQKDSEINRIFLECQQNYMNHLLRARGHVFLNEVYDALGLERSQAGQVVGWIIDGDGDGFVDFGLYEADNSRFINNIERSVLLDFNVDGQVYDKI